MTDRGSQDARVVAGTCKSTADLKLPAWSTGLPQLERRLTTKEGVRTSRDTKVLDFVPHVTGMLRRRVLLRPAKVSDRHSCSSPSSRQTLSLREA